MRRVLSWIGAVISISVLVGCGGGGGDTGSAPIALAIKVNGATRAADSSGQLAVAPGDQVEISSGQPTNWTGVSSIDSSVTVRNAAISPTVWSSQIINEKNSVGTYIVTAIPATDSTRRTSISLSVSGGNPQNGSYEVFAYNGSRPKLKLNFDVKTYELDDPENSAASVNGEIAADEREGGTWNFVSPRGSPAPSAKFRMTANTVVGNFPFFRPLLVEGYYATTDDAYTVQPFLGSRALQTKQEALEGSYNTFGITLGIQAFRNTGTIVQPTQILPGGRTMLTCTLIFPINSYYGVPTPVAGCPTDATNTFDIRPSDTPGYWSLTNVATGASGGTFSIADVDGENVYLQAGNSPTFPDHKIFRIGVIESDFTDFVSRGGSPNGIWNIVTAINTTDSSILARIAGVDSSNFSSNNYVGWASFAGIDSRGQTLGSGRGSDIIYQNTKISGLKSGFRLGTNYLTRGKKIALVVGTGEYVYLYIHVGLID